LTVTKGTVGPDSGGRREFFKTLLVLVMWF